MIRLGFKGKTNSEFIYVNYITFEFKDGRQVNIDRNRTEYVIDNGGFEMIWKGIYIWDGKKHDYKLDTKLFDGAKIVHIDIDDEAPSNYGIDISYWKAFES